MKKYWSSWEVYIGSIRKMIQEALDRGEISESDIVWGGPSGDIVIAPSPADLEEEYDEYIDRGTVTEYLD